MAKVMKMLAILLMATVLVAAITTSVYATDGSNPASETTDVNQFATHGDSSEASNATRNVIGALISVFQIIGTGVAIIMLVVLAIKYISAAPGDKAEIKKHAVVYVVGAVVLFAATGLLGIVKSFAEKNINNATT